MADIITSKEVEELKEQRDKVRNEASTLLSNLNDFVNDYAKKNNVTFSDAKKALVNNPEYKNLNQLVNDKQKEYSELNNQYFEKNKALLVQQNNTESASTSSNDSGNKEELVADINNTVSDKVSITDVDSKYKIESPSDENVSSKSSSTSNIIDSIKSYSGYGAPGNNVIYDSRGGNTISSPNPSINGSLGQRNAYTVRSENLGGRRYYHTIDASILINGNIVTEATVLDWNIQEATMPLFGYNSYVWDEVAKGARMINGQLVINFVTTDYLNLIINGYDDTKFEHDALAKKTSYSKVDYNKHRPMFGNSFTISIGYGSDEESKNMAVPMTIIDQVFLTSLGVVQSVDGGPLQEMYQFIGRDRKIVS